MSDAATMDAQVFESFCSLIYGQAGIKLGPHKEALVCARVGKRMRKLGIRDFSDYYSLVEQDADGTEIVELLDAICTNVTHFFRESTHFDLIGSLVREWEEKGQHRFRIWCTAASTGEEPYSVAMTLKENLKRTDDALILASDLSTKVLARAREGIYEERHMETVPTAFVKQYFTRKDADGGARFVIRDDLKRMLRFARINLSTPPFPMTGPLDIILCRNVMIYFDNAVRKRLLTALYDLLRPGGYLIVGHAESLSGMLSNFKSDRPSVYRKG